MKKNNSAKRGPQDTSQPASQPEKIGWIRKFCGKGIFREIWKNRFVVLKGDQLYISEKECGSMVRTEGLGGREGGSVAQWLGLRGWEGRREGGSLARWLELWDWEGRRQCGSVVRAVRLGGREGGRQCCSVVRA
ncbi:Pleckstrin homology domain-containing family O member 1 [Acipenser ruthenus]|uniref:Pleckstrin homology domain-containing family O member 1 n=1 Tax=Acipenser ruthenus TaxID=7906 RepID=A0A662YX40_ACIRT|nr:Pleckstrin homology domain-containing family O member 1 [Acipenser ruthenus]